MLKDKNLLVFLILTFLVCFLGYFLVYQKKYVNQPIRADAEGYYAYLPAFLIYQDFSLAKADFYQPQSKFLVYPAIYFNSSTNNYINKYPLGVALLVLPFFVLAHLVSGLAGLPLTGYTFLYQHFVGLAGIFYLALGLFFLAKLYRNFFSRKVVLLTLLSLVFATNLFHYATFDSLMSHVYSFSLISLFLYQVHLWQKNPTKAKSIIIGFLIGLIFLVRNINLAFVLILLPFVKKHRKYFPSIAFSFLIVCLPQLLYWYSVAGKFILFSYQSEGFNFYNPKILQVLFFPRKGLFFWAPIFLLGLLAIKDLKKRIGPLFSSFLFVLPLFLYLVSSWYDWAYGASFGNRVFIDTYPLLGFFLASFFEKALKKPEFRKVFYFQVSKNKLVYALLIFFVFLNLTNMFKYWQRILPYDQVSLEIYLKNLFIFLR